MRAEEQKQSSCRNSRPRSRRRREPQAPSPAHAVAAELAMKVPPFEMPLEEIRASLETLRRPLSVAVLRARNPFNVGAIIRVAHSFLVREIVLVGRRAAITNAARWGWIATRTSCASPGEAELVARARGRGGKLMVFEKDAARVDLWHAELPAECTMVFGSESDRRPRRHRARRRHGRRHPDVRHQPLVPRHRRRRHRDGRVDPPPLRQLTPQGSRSVTGRLTARRSRAGRNATPHSEGDPDRRSNARCHC